MLQDINRSVITQAHLECLAKHAQRHRNVRATERHRSLSSMNGKIPALETIFFALSQIRLG
jgi:hypothetical protein